MFKKFVEISPIICQRSSNILFGKDIKTSFLNPNKNSFKEIPNIFPTTIPIIQISLKTRWHISLKYLSKIHQKILWRSLMKNPLKSMKISMEIFPKNPLPFSVHQNLFRNFLANPPKNSSKNCCLIAPKFPLNTYHNILWKFLKIY